MRGTGRGQHSLLKHGALSAGRQGFLDPNSPSPRGGGSGRRTWGGPTGGPIRGSHQHPQRLPCGNGCPGPVLWRTGGLMRDPSLPQSCRQRRCWEEGTKVQPRGGGTDGLQLLCRGERSSPQGALPQLSGAGGVALPPGTLMHRSSCVMPPAQRAPLAGAARSHADHLVKSGFQIGDK